jgi:hypothetical protein
VLAAPASITGFDAQPIKGHYDGKLWAIVGRRLGFALEGKPWTRLTLQIPPGY